FEDTLFCPQSPVTPGTLIGAKNWLIPTNGTPDYFNSCSSQSMGVPQNVIGFQEAQHGNAYVGMLTYYVFENTREYLCSKLITPLENGKRYYWCFWVSLADSL